MFQRSHLKTLISRVKEQRKFIQILLGPRQVGKTTLIKQLIKNTKENIHFSSADDVVGGASIWIDEQWEAVRIKQKQTKEPYILIFDEIQKINSWSETVKKNWDQDTVNNLNIKLILLGSAQLTIQQGLTESLAGRFETILVQHWSFSEIQEAFGLTAEEYVWFGGYPGAIALIEDEERWKDYIKNSLIETTVSKDILLQTRVDKPTLLKRLFELSCYYSGQILSYNKMLGQLQDAGNTTTLSHYLNLLSSAELVTGLEKYSGKILKRKGSSPKLQVLNTALMSVQSQETYKETVSNPKRWGRFVESAVGAHLINMSKINGTKVSYWREGNDEVDFVLEKEGRVIALEIKSGNREKTQGMEKFKKTFNPHKSLLIGDSGFSWQEFLQMNPSDIF